MALEPRPNCWTAPPMPQEVHSPRSRCLQGPSGTLAWMLTVWPTFPGILLFVPSQGRTAAGHVPPDGPGPTRSARQRKYWAVGFAIIIHSGLETALPESDTVTRI